MINQASQTATKAAQEIQANAVQNKEDSFRAGGIENLPSQVNQSTPSYQNNTDPLLDLNQAVQYNRVGTNIVQKNQEMIGSLLDVRV
ncbi:hypothetical protein OAP63_01815 [Vibrio sp.]|nr:hypothetical protein [Vibrio sp.]